MPPALVSEDETPAASAPSLDGGRSIKKLVGCANFLRTNPRTDLFEVRKFHHVEFWCPDATNAYKRFQIGLGMSLVARSEQSSGNKLCASYVTRSKDLVFAFTTPYPSSVAAGNQSPSRGFDAETCREFIREQGFGVRAVGLLVGDAREAFVVAVAHGAEPVCPPVELDDPASGTKQRISEVKLYGRVVLRFVSGDYDGPFLAGFEQVDGPQLSYGLSRLDHAVGNVENLLETVNYMMGFTGFHEFAEFTAEDVGTVESGLNSMVLANNNETVLLPVNEPIHGTKRQSQIQTFLDHNCGPGLQHLALKTDDVFATVAEMRKYSEFGGFEFMPRPSDSYYRELPSRIGNSLSPKQYEDLEKLGLLADKDDQGVLLQVFTKPVSDRPTIFLEIIQRVGCEREVLDEFGNPVIEQSGGCGGFGKGNFAELFKSIEDYEKSLGV
ncbi:hypothetical protein BSKO_10684 [Bryopsis sp. KO-2023]|nr:hypothetical protein BSKO_10684 [Bryopsis sp. KO-2023]